MAHTHAEKLAYNRHYYLTHFAGRPRVITPAPPDEIRICEICGQSFSCGSKEWASHFRKRRTCGRECGSILRGRERRYLPDRECPGCGKTFAPRLETSRYCSQQCYWEKKKGSKATYIPPLIQRILVVCPWCLVMHQQLPCEMSGGHFCSQKCYRDFLAHNRAGKPPTYAEEHPFYGTTGWVKRRREVKERDKYTCQACLITFPHSSRSLVAHHIRPRALFSDASIDLHPIADAAANLITLCLSCHQKTHVGRFPQFLDISP